LAYHLRVKKTRNLLLSDFLKGHMRTSGKRGTSKPVEKLRKRHSLTGGVSKRGISVIEKVWRTREMQ